MARLREILPELHAYLGLALAAVGAGFLFWPAGLMVGGLGLFVLSYRVKARHSTHRGAKGHTKISDLPASASVVGNDHPAVNWTS